MNEIAENLSKLIRTFNDKRVISEGEIKEVLTAIVAILAENKRQVQEFGESHSQALTKQTQKRLEETISYLEKEHKAIIASITGDLKKTRTEIEKATKEQNQRAFQRLQDLIDNIKLPKDGKSGIDGLPGVEGPPGKDGSPDTAFQVRDKLETLKGEDRLDAFAIKNLPKFIKEKGKELVVGGIRFFENLVDVSILPTKKREDLLVQYNNTNNRWEDGVALTVSTTAPTSPQVNDLWVDLN